MTSPPSPSRRSLLSLGFLIEWRRIGNDAARIAELEARVANLESRLLAVENRHDRIDRAR